jgi:hypothetical protein
MAQKHTAVDANNLPGLLSAVLAHPDLPERIFTGIADNLLDMNLSAQVNFFTPDMIERTLDAYAKHNTKRQKEKGRK